MKAFVINRYGKKEMGHISVVPEPKLGEEDILIQVQAPTINPLDLKSRSGELNLILRMNFP